MSKVIVTAEGRKYLRVSRWIKLYDLRDDYGFRHNGRRYRLSQFMRLTYPEFYRDEDGKDAFLSAYDALDSWWPLVLEMDYDGSGYIRLYLEQRKEED